MTRLKPVDFAHLQQSIHMPWIDLKQGHQLVRICNWVKLNLASTNEILLTMRLDSSHELPLDFSPGTDMLKGKPLFTFIQLLTPSPPIELVHLFIQHFSHHKSGKRCRWRILGFGFRYCIAKLRWDARATFTGLSCGGNLR